MANRTLGEVTFITPNGPLEIRMSDMPHDIVKGAATLRARYVVFVHERNMLLDIPIWGVFDMKKVRKNDPMPGQFAIPLPSKTFESDSPDGAVMWALAQGSV